MEQQQWSEWIKWNGGECPIPHAKAGEWQGRYKDGDICGNGADATDLRWHWINGGSGGDKVAYRVKLTAQADPRPEEEPDPDDELTDADVRMIAADLREPSPKPQPVAVPAPVECCPLLVVAPMERLGATRWGAQ